MILRKLAIEMADTPDCDKKSVTLVSAFISSSPEIKYCLGDIGFYLFSGMLRCLLLYLLNKMVKSILPLICGKNPYLNLFMLFNVNFFKGPEDAIFENSFYSPRHILLPPTFKDKQRGA